MYEVVEDVRAAAGSLSFLGHVTTDKMFVLFGSAGFCPADTHSSVFAPVSLKLEARLPDLLQPLFI